MSQVCLTVTVNSTGVILFSSVVFVWECESEREGEVSSWTDEHDVIGTSQTEKDGRDLHEDNYQLSPQNTLPLHETAWAITDLLLICFRWHCLDKVCVSASVRLNDDHWCIQRPVTDNKRTCIYIHTHTQTHKLFASLAHLPCALCDDESVKVWTVWAWRRKNQWTFLRSVMLIFALNLLY